jgi:hypothetical protein
MRPILGGRRVCLAVVVVLAAAVVACSGSPSASKSPSKSPQPTAGSATLIGLSFPPAELTFSAGSNKLYVSEVFPESGATYVVSMSAPGKAPARLDESINGFSTHIVVNGRLKLGYALIEKPPLAGSPALAGVVRVFNTDTDTLISTSTQPSCVAQVLTVNEASGMVYGGGMSPAGECLIEFDSAGHIVRQADVAPLSRTQNRLIQRIETDPATGDVVYMDPYSVGRADQSLTEKWRTPVPGAGVPSNTVFPSQGQGNDMGFEPTSDTVYVSVCGAGVIAPATIAIYDGHTGKQTGQFTGPGSSSQFAADHDGRLFAAFYNSSDLYVLSHGATTLTKFAALANVPDLSPDDAKWLAVDLSAHRLFVSPGGNAHSVYLYSY